MKEVIINNKYDNKKLTKYLLDNFPKVTLNIIYKTLRKKDIQLNGKRINENVTLHENDILKIYISDDILYYNTNIKIEIIYEDSNIIVFNKPIGIEVTGNNSYTDIIHTNISPNYMPCHRLDRNTSGLLIFAKNKESLKILFNKFKNKEIEKHYKALVYGIPQKRQDRLIAYLFKDSKKSIVYISDTPKKGYIQIITSYKILNVNKSNNTSVLDVNLETGRTHQIRAHLAHIGHPIIGDGKYGRNEINKKFHKKTQELSSYLVKFNFKTDAGILNYLKNRSLGTDLKCPTQKGAKHCQN